MSNSPVSRLASKEELIGLLRNIASHLNEFAARYAEAVACRPELRDEIAAAGYSASFLDKIEQFAKGKLDQRLLIPTGRQYQLLAKCPLSTQKKAFEDGVEVLEPNGTDSRTIPLDSLTPKQSSQVIASGHLRSLAEQRTWLNARAPKPATPEAVRIQRDCVLFHGHQIHKKTLLQWLQEMN